MMALLREDRRPQQAGLRLGMLLAALLVASCTVGPRYHRAAVSTPVQYKESAAAAYRQAPPGTWRPATPADSRLKGPWWGLFQDPQLDALERQLDINNQTIAEYYQDFLAARAELQEARASLFPSATVQPAYTRSHSPNTIGGVFAGGSTSSTGSTAGGTAGSGGGTATGGSSGVTTTGSTVAYSGSFVSLPLAASWEPDLFGRIRNTVSQYRYGAQVSAADLENERLVEEAALAEYYFELRGQDSLQSLYDATVQADRQALAINQGLYETGVGDAESVAQARVTLADAEATAAGLAANRAVYEHAIATLIGRPASGFSLPVHLLDTPIPAIPVGVPSELLERRPDIAAAERTMAEANAQIGIATAAYYPSLTLSGSAGFESTGLGSLLSAPSFFWSVGASAAETVFDAGLRRATVAQYQAAFQADVAAYRQTVLTAFQQVEDYIATLRVDSAQLQRQQAAVQAAQQYLNIALARYQTGVDPYLNVTTAQLTLLTDQQTAISEQVNELVAAVQLIQALGGGWQQSELPPAGQIGSSASASQLAPGSSRVMLTGQ